MTKEFVFKDGKITYSKDTDTGEWLIEDEAEPNIIYRASLENTVKELKEMKKDIEKFISLYNPLVNSIKLPNGSQLSWQVNPNIDPLSLITSKDITNTALDQLKDSTVSAQWNKEYKEDNVNLWFNINMKPFKLYKQDEDVLQFKFGATKKF